MKKIVLIVFMLGFVFFAMAHPPKKVDLKYENGKVSVEALHKVKDANKHFIGMLIVTINEAEPLEFDYTKQTSTTVAKITLDLPELKSGDVVKVKAKCNKGGARAAEITIE